MSLLTKIQTLLSTWFPNKVQDKVNFDKWTNQMVTYDDGVLRISDAFHTNNILKWDTITSGNDSFKISSYEINSKNYLKIQDKPLKNIAIIKHTHEILNSRIIYK